MAGKDPRKKMGRNKILTCFNPVANDDGPCCFSAPQSCSDGEGEIKRKTRLCRSFSGVMKAVLSKASLGKKLQNKKSRQELYRSNSDSTWSTSENLSIKKKSSHKGSFSDHENNIMRTNSSAHNSSLFSSNSSRTTTCSSLSAFSSRTSSFSSNSERITRLPQVDLKNIKRKKSMKKSYGRFGSNFKSHYTTGVSMFVICLLALACYGKVFAIFTCTSAWLFFAPARRFHTVDLLEDDVDTGDTRKRCL